MKKYEYELLANYGNGFEPVISADTKKEILEYLKEYQENDNFAYMFKIKKVKKS